MKHKIIVWQCRYCKDIIMSDSREHHKLDMCKCEKCFMDLEQYGNRLGCDKESDIKILFEKVFECGNKI